MASGVVRGVGGAGVALVSTRVSLASGLGAGGHLCTPVGGSEATEGLDGCTTLCKPPLAPEVDGRG